VGLGVPPSLVPRLIVMGSPGQSRSRSIHRPALSITSGRDRACHHHPHPVEREASLLCSAMKNRHPLSASSQRLRAGTGAAVPEPEEAGQACPSPPPNASAERRTDGRVRLRVRT
jgi:hypothetical protein